MEIKRNPVGQMTLNQSKAGHLMQPLLNISKASTPVRTRVVVGTPQPNSTPISINKIAGNSHKSPNNKENYRNNRIQGSSKAMGNEPQSKINLSPILALNKKLTEGPKYNQKKSLTPQNHKINQDYEGYEFDKKGNYQKNFNTLSSINDSKSKSNYNSTTNLRGSNCFKALLQNRTKSPNRFEGSSGSKMMHRKESPMLKQSMSSNQLFNNMGFDSKGKLAQSRSYDQLKNVSNYRLENSQIKCMNNDGKKAKYRVLNNEEGDNSHLYYCSKCTIPLVQQGFIVEEIGKQIVKDSYRHPEANRLNECRFKLEQVKKNTECVLIQMKEKEEQELSHLDQYYSIIFDFLQRQRKSQKVKIGQYYSQKMQQPSEYSKQISEYIEDVDSILNNRHVNSFNLKEVQDILEGQVNFINPRELGCFEQNIQFLSDKFFKVYEEHLKIPIGIPKNIAMLQSKGYPQSTHSSSRNNAMRFSFEKLITANHNNKKKTMEAMNPLLEVQEEEFAQNQASQPQKQEHTAYRDLFPEGDEQQQNVEMSSPTFKNI